MPKKLYLFALLLFSVLLISSCNKESILPEKEQGSGDFSVTDVSASVNISLSGDDLSGSSSLHLDNNKDAALIIIESNELWTATTGNEWLILSAYSGSSGSTGILAGAYKNKSVPRQSEITIRSGNKTHIISVEQKGASYLTFSLNDVSFKMILVEADTFILGDNNLFGSTPEYEVSLSSYYICET